MELNGKDLGIVVNVENAVLDVILPKKMMGIVCILNGYQKTVEFVQEGIQIIIRMDVFTGQVNLGTLIIFQNVHISLQK